MHLVTSSFLLQVAMAFNLLAMASNLVAMASTYSSFLLLVAMHKHFRCGLMISLALCHLPRGAKVTLNPDESIISQVFDG